MRENLITLALVVLGVLVIFVLPVVFATQMTGILNQTEQRLLVGFLALGWFTKLIVDQAVAKIDKRLSLIEHQLGDSRNG